MAKISISHDHDTRKSFFLSVKNYPPVINGRINIVEFIDAASDLISIVERLGAVFAPVKYDMQVNFDRIKQHFTYDNNSCLLELVLSEATAGRPGSLGLLWFNRAMLFLEIVLSQLLRRVKTNVSDANMQQILTVAYEGSVKKYHNWATQSTLVFIGKAAPSIPQFLKALEVEDRINELEIKLETYHKSLHLVRSKIDDFFHVNRICV